MSTIVTFMPKFLINTHDTAQWITMSTSGCFISILKCMNPQNFNCQHSQVASISILVQLESNKRLTILSPSSLRSPWPTLSHSFFTPTCMHPANCCWCLIKQRYDPTSWSSTFETSLLLILLLWVNTGVYLDKSMFTVLSALILVIDHPWWSPEFHYQKNYVYHHCVYMLMSVGENLLHPHWLHLIHLYRLHIIQPYSVSIYNEAFPWESGWKHRMKSLALMFVTSAWPC